MSELLFECYSIPEICFGVDALFALHENCDGEEISKTTDALIISCGFHTVHVIPVLNGEVYTEGIRRINVGGFHLVNFLHRGLQLKYSAHINNITVIAVQKAFLKDLV